MNIRIALCGAAAASTLVLVSGAFATTKKAQKASLSFDSSEVRMASFSGSRIKIGNLWTVEPDCKSMQPDVRIVKEPKGGELSFEELRAKASLPSNHVSAHCNGKMVNGMNVFYESRDDYSGTDRFEIEVDYKTGVARKYTVFVNVR